MNVHLWDSSFLQSLNGLKKKKCKDIIVAVANTVEQFANFAMEMGLGEKTYESIQKILNQNKIELQKTVGSCKIILISFDKTPRIKL